MLKKILLLVILSTIISNCDYSPIYVKNKNFNFDFSVIEITGDNIINNFLVKDLDQQSNNDSTNKFDLKINTSFTKRVLARNSKGISTDFELKANSSFFVKYNNTEETFSIEEKFNYKKLSNNYEQNNYEKTIKKNIASSIARKLILRLAVLND